MRRIGEKLWFYGAVGIINLAVGVMLLVVNIPTLFPSVTAVRVMPIPISKVHTYVQLVPIKQGIPTHITIPSLAIDLPVGMGTYDPNSDSWNVDATMAYYADTSVPINDHNGTTLIYGHAQTPVFASLPNIQVGSEAIVTTDSGYVFHYRYQSMTEILPTDTSVFTADGPPILTLQTCMGDWSTYRGMFSFTLESVNKS